MKIAFAGKGGSGKTTLSSLFTRHLAGQGLPVVAIDADINQHLAEALGAAAAGIAPAADQGVPARQQPEDHLGRGDGQDHPARPRVPAAAARRPRSRA
jgi:CO dehydrogenase maturation factor